MKVFINNNNMCYFNSCVQIFVDTIFDELVGLDEGFRDRLVDGGNLKRVLSNHNSFFKLGGQQDCHECYVCMVDALNSILPVVPQKLPPKLKEGKSVSAKKQFKEIRNTCVSNLYFGQLEYKLKCSVCFGERYNYEIINNISVPVMSGDVAECIRKFLSEEVLESGIECEKCGRNTPTSKKVSMYRFPKMLVINLKKLSVGKIEYYDELIFCDYDTKNKLIYKLVTVVNHYGNHSSGHYTVLKKDGNNWYNINDENIYKTDPKVSENVYILVYKMV